MQQINDYLNTFVPNNPSLDRFISYFCIHVCIRILLYTLPHIFHFSHLIYHFVYKVSAEYFLSSLMMPWIGESLDYIFNFYDSSYRPQSNQFRLWNSSQKHHIGSWFGIITELRIAIPLWNLPQNRIARWILIIWLVIEARYSEWNKDLKMRQTDSAHSNADIIVNSNNY